MSSSTHIFSNWINSSANDRKENLEHIINHLGSDWKIEADYLRHSPSKKLFTFIPGGRMTQGVSPEKLFELCTKRERFDFEDSSWPEEIIKLRPSKDVWVYPFLISLESERRELEATNEYGFSLPSESELEWVFSYGGQTSFVAESKAFGKKKKGLEFTSPFGLNNLSGVGAQCIDDWHPTLKDKPDTSLPWGTNRGVAKDVHTTWQDETEEIIAWHVSYRGKCSGKRDHYDVVRLNDLFNDTVSLSIEKTNLVKEILENGKAADKKALIGMLELIAYAPSGDMHLLLEQAIENIDTDPKLTPKILKAISSIVCGVDFEEQLFSNTTFSEEREELAAIIDKYSEKLIALLDVSNTVVVKSNVANILSVSSKQEVFEAYLNLYKGEKHSTVIEALYFASAFYNRMNKVNKLLFEEVENQNDKTPDYLKTVVKSICLQPDYCQLLEVLKSGKVASKHTFIFVYLMLSAHVEKEILAKDLAELGKNLISAIKEPQYKREKIYPLFELLKRSIQLAFPKQSKNTATPWLIKPETITPNQRETLAVFKESIAISKQNFNLGWMNDLRLPTSDLGWSILLGDSDSVFGENVTYNEIEMPIYWALYDIRQLEGDEALLNFFNSLNYKQLLNLYIKFKTGLNDLPWRFKTHCEIVIVAKFDGLQKEFNEYVIPQVQEYLELGEEVRNSHAHVNLNLIELTAFITQHNPQSQLWFLNELNFIEIDALKMEFGNVNLYSLFSEPMLREKVKGFGDICIKHLRAGDFREKVKYNGYVFQEFFNPKSDIKLVMGLLAIEEFAYTSFVIKKIKSGEEYNRFYEVIPEEYFNDTFFDDKNPKTGAKPIGFEKLWQIFLDDTSFSV